MTDIKFTPDAWRRGGGGYVDEAENLGTSISSRIAGLSEDALGCYTGEHVADAALAIVVPLLKYAFNEASYNLATNLALVGQAMIVTGLIYEAEEDINTDLSNQIMGG